MLTFYEMCQLLETDWAKDMKNVAAGLASGFRAAADEKVADYARRIMAGEPTEQVLQGIKANGAMATAVMNKVRELQVASQPTPEFSVSSLEQRLGVRPQTLNISLSKDKQYAFVRNRITGTSIAASPNPAAIEAAAKKVLGIL